MFFADTLLTKTGALARVWVSSNIEKKLTKSQILQSDIEQSVNTIIDPGQAPMALRLSGQLLLGVVRIYRRKVGYLLDDCNEQHTRVRMTFKSGANIDRTDTANPTNEALNIQEKLTDADIFAAFDLGGDLFSQPLFAEVESTPRGRGLDFTSSLIPGSSTHSRLTPEERPQLEDDTGVELDLGFDDPINEDTGVSVEIGRPETTTRPVGEDLFSDDEVLDADELGLDLGFGDDAPVDEPPPRPGPTDEEIDNAIGMDDDMGIGLGGDMPVEPEVRPRDSESPLSEPPEIASGNLDHIFAEPEDVEEEEHIAQQPQRSRKRKLIVPDNETVIHNHIIKQQQTDRSKILRPATFLPRDPFLLSLMRMQENGGFVKNVMEDRRARNWAPELRGLLSIDAIRGANDLKRKRDSGVADLSGDEEPAKTPRLDLGGDEDEAFPPMEDEGFGGGDSTLNNETRFSLPGAIGPGGEAGDGDADGEPRPTSHDGEDEGIGPDYNDDYDPAFDDTTAPLVHPADSGPVSLGTKHAVHLLRDRFGGSAADSSPKKAQVLFQELLPEGKTTKEDATKMFFEVLVLATKDAVKVEQVTEKGIGLPLRIRGKRGLWGDWAEREAGGEIAEEKEGEKEKEKGRENQKEMEREGEMGQGQGMEGLVMGGRVQEVTA